MPPMIDADGVLANANFGFKILLKRCKKSATFSRRFEIPEAVSQDPDPFVDGALLPVVFL